MKNERSEQEGKEQEEEQNKRKSRNDGQKWKKKDIRSGRKMQERKRIHKRKS